MIEDDNKLMMSQELLGIIPDFDDQFQQDKFFISYKTSKADLAFVFPLTQISVGENLSIECIANLEHSLEVIRNYNEISIKEINLIYQDSSSSFEGSFKVTTAALKIVNLKDKTCLLSLNLMKNS